MKHIVLPGLTTTPNSDWRGKIKEIDQLDLKEIALFPTFLKIDEREELYDLLEKTKLERILHVHLRDDHKDWELDYCISRWKSHLFNIHPNKAGSDFLRKSPRRKMIYVENLHCIDKHYLEAMRLGAGICIDFSHWQDQGLFQKHEGYDKFPDIIKDNKVGCCHISAIIDAPFEYVDPITGNKHQCQDDHTLSDFKQLNYIKNFLEYLPEIVSIELENTFKEQLEVRKYLEKIINT